MKFSIKHIFKYMVAGAVFALASCSDDIMVSERTDNIDASLGLTFRCSDMLEVYRGQNNEATRAGGPKEADEKKIKTLHVFFFGSDNELLVPNYQSFPPYQKINVEDEIGETELAFIKLPSEYQGQTEEGYPGLFRDKNNNPANENIRVVAIANIDAVEGVDPNDAKNSFNTSWSTEGQIQEAGRSGDKLIKIERYADLKEWVYYPKIRMNEEEGDISKLPKSGMPMIGEAVITSVAKKPNNPYVINMRALMAKVNISIKLDPDQFTNNLPSLTINEYGIMNMPVAVPFDEPKGGLNEGKEWTKPTSLDEYFDTYDVTNQPMYHKDGNPSNWNTEHNNCAPESHEYTNKINPIRIDKDSDPVLFSYYTFENVNMPNYSAERSGKFAEGDNNKYAFKPFTPPFTNGFEPNYPPGVSKDDYQRWKPTIAYTDRASALILKGDYTTHQGLTYKAQFTFYLGVDNEVDFKVKRNHQYDNNIVITGLDYVRNSVDDVYTFDGRVNVTYENPLYLAIVNERKVDAHATALPMDVWLMNYEDSNPEPEDYYTDVIFTIPNNDPKTGVDPRKWIQMVMIPRSEMESYDGRFYAGTGIEKYFYTNLLTDISTYPERVLKSWTDPSTGARAYVGHNDGAQCGSEVTVTCTPTVNNSRSRIYFYIDENVGNLGDGKDRSVDIEVYYRPYTLKADGSKNYYVDLERKRTLTIEQRGLMPVEVNYNNKNYDTFIEYYEEYLDHNDPLEEHDSDEVYVEGLKWGLYDVKVFKKLVGDNTGFGGSDDDYSHQVYTKKGAFNMMRWAFGQDDYKKKYPITDLHLYNNKKPESAFHYCWGKNRRKYDGSVDLGTSGTKGWYFPGIKELENAIVKYYELFEDFQGKKYWSCACGEAGKNWGIYYDNYKKNARATMITIEKDKKTGEDVITYMKSGYGEDGDLDRNEEHRIRAFYSKN